MNPAMRVFVPFSVLLSVAAVAQTGPGGVGNSTTNVLWLSAESGVYNNAGTVLAASNDNVQQWNDRSGNAKHATQVTLGNRPNLITGALNGYPVIRYAAANNDRMLSTGLSTANSASIWVVARYSSLPSSNPGLLQGAASGNGYSGAPGDKNIGMWVSSTTTQVCGRGIQSDGTQRNVTMSTALSSGQTYVLNTMYRTASIDQYVNHGAAGSVATDGTLRTWTDMAIGCQAGTESWNGDIAEVVAYNVLVNDAQRLLVANYLAAKYGLTLTANDVYQQDNTANGDFDHDVAGIGRISASHTHTTARGSGILEITKAAYTGLGNNEFLMWGHNNGQLGAWGVGDLPTGVQGRSGRVWRFSERNTTGASAVDVGAVDIRFDLSGLGPVTAGDLALLIDTDGDGSFSDETPITGAALVGGSVYQFTNISALYDGVRITFGTLNMGTTPLPIELVAFDAEPMGMHTVRTTWTTASERDNDHFAVERSLDGSSWEVAGTMAGAGNSTMLLHYELVDPAAYGELIYYRLRQTDTNGNSTISSVRVVQLDGQVNAPTIYPNPANGRFTVAWDMEVGEGAVYELIDAAGRRSPIQVFAIGGLASGVQMMDVKPGLYIFRAMVADRVLTSQPLLVQ